MNHLTLLIWMMNASSLLFVCDCWAATSTTMSSAEMATEDTRAEVIKDSSSTSSSAAAAASVERKCFVCYSCKRVETSQSVPCSEDEDQCMVRLVYVLGRVIYDRVWNRKNYFEIVAFLNLEWGTSIAGSSNENKIHQQIHEDATCKITLSFQFQNIFLMFCTTTVSYVTLAWPTLSSHYYFNCLFTFFGLFIYI